MMRHSATAFCLSIILLQLTSQLGAADVALQPSTGRSLSAAVTMGCGDIKDSSGSSVSWMAAPSVSTYASSTKKAYKIARQSVYEGPLGHTGMCGKPLFSDPSIEACAVAIGRNHLTHEDQSACGKCMCVRVLGADTKCNGNAPAGTVSKVKGKKFKCKVMDQCPECEEDHIDVLLDGPFADADDVSQNNPLSSQANANWNKISGYEPIVSGQEAKTVGVFVSEWFWADCNADCDGLFALGDGAQQQAAVRRPTVRMPTTRMPTTKAPTTNAPKKSPPKKSPPKKSPPKKSPAKKSSPKKYVPKPSTPKTGRKLLL